MTIPLGPAGVGSPARQAADPATSAETLAALSTSNPELRPLIAAHPSAYEGLLDWLGQLGDPAVDAALDRRNGIDRLEVAPTRRWTEPSRRVPLRWGTYGLRYGITIGIIVIAAFTLGAQAFTSNQIGPTLASMGGMALAWVALPATIGRRLAAAAISVAAGGLWFTSWTVLYIDFIVLLPIALTLALTAWLVARSRTGLSYLALIIPVVMGILDYGGQGWYSLRSTGIYWDLFQYPLLNSGLATNDSTSVLLSLSSAVFMVLYWSLSLVPAAWLARLIAGARGDDLVRAEVRARALADATAEQHAVRARQEDEWRVTQLKNWERAYALAHDGQLPPPGFMPPMTSAPNAGGQTNTGAILALVFGIGGGLLGIVFGHMARAQIRRTGEQGWGIATAGLVLGYIGLGAGVAFVVIYLVLFGIL